MTPERAEALAAALRAGGNRAVAVRLFPQTHHLMVADPSAPPIGAAPRVHGGTPWGSARFPSGKALLRTVARVLPCARQRYLLGDTNFTMERS